MNQKSQSSATNKVKSVTAVFLLVFVNMIGLLAVMPPALGAGEKIYGKITIAGSSTNLSGAYIEVISPVTGDFMTANSDAQGNYSINLPTTGKYFVTVAKPGYSGDTKNVTITTGQKLQYNKSLQVDTTAPTISGFGSSVSTGISPNQVTTISMTVNEKWLAVARIDIFGISSLKGDNASIMTVKEYTSMPLYENPGNPLELLTMSQTAPGTNTTTVTFDGTSTFAKFGDTVNTYNIPYSVPFWSAAGNVLIINCYYTNTTVGTNLDSWYLEFDAVTLHLKQIDRYVVASATFIPNAVDLNDASGKVQIMEDQGTFNTTTGKINTMVMNVTPFINVNAINPLVLDNSLPSGQYIISGQARDFSDNGAKNWTKVTVDNTPPVAQAGANITIKQGEMAKFNGSASSDNMGITNYSWSFRVGAFDLHAYGEIAMSPVVNAIGVYTVALNVTDVGGWTNTDVTYLNVTDGIAPVANAGANITGMQDVKFFFNATKTTDNVDTLAQMNYTWVFNDTVKTVTLYGAQPNYTLAKIGVYKVNLSVTDRNGNKAAPAFVWVNITDGHAPVAKAGTDFTIKQMVLAHFNGSASTDNVGVVNYTWNFTDTGTPIVLHDWNATYTFVNIGIYNVTLTVKDKAGMMSTDTMVVTVVDGLAPVANAGADQQDEVGVNMTFNASASSDNVGIVSYNWSFGDGTWASSKVVVHAWATVGNYSVILTVKDAQNNTATDKVNVTVEPKNRPPILAPLGNVTVYFGQNNQIFPVYSDPDKADIDTFALSNAPAGMTIFPGNGTIQWTPSPNQLWNYYNVTVSISDSKATTSRVFTIRAILRTIVVKFGPIKDTDGNIVKGAAVTILGTTNTYTNKTDDKGIAYISVPGQMVNQPVNYLIKKAGYKDTKTLTGTILTSGIFSPVNGYPRLHSKQGTDYTFLVIVIVVLLVLGFVLFSLKRPVDDDSVLDDDEMEPGEEDLSEEE